MSKVKIILILLCFGLFYLGVQAHDFSVAVGTQRLYFNITSKSLQTAEVTYEGSIRDNKSLEFRGSIEIPAKVKHENVVYNITAIGAKAFNGAIKLTKVVMPTSIEKIGDFAFEGCSSLTNVVFPGGEVKFGQGIFFKCVSLKDLSFGSDWKQIDLTPYRWSDSLKVISIPAKVEKIQNLKLLKNLSTIEVDPNNQRFSSYNGALYNKSGEVLYGVPRGYLGTLKVKDGTTRISQGALIDCPNITSIILPSSLKEMSFRETSRMSELKEVIIKADTPIMTAYADGLGRFLLQVANASVKIIVPKQAKSKYLEAFETTQGEYLESLDGNVPYMVLDANMPKQKNVSGTKNFDDYE